MTGYHTPYSSHLYMYKVSCDGFTVSHFPIFHEAYMCAIATSHDHQSSEVLIERYEQNGEIGAMIPDKSFKYVFVNGEYVAKRG